MVTRVLLRALGAVAAAGAALGAYKLEVWHADPSNGYLIEDPNEPGRVVIIHPGVYKIFAYDDQTLQPADISSITVSLFDPGELPDTVTVYVVPKEGTGVAYGAANLHRIDLSSPYEEYAGVIQDLLISGDLGETGPTVSTAAGTLTIGNDVLDAIDVTANIDSLSVGGGLLADVTSETIGSVTIVQLDAVVTGRPLGPVNIGDVQHHTHSGGLHVTGHLDYPVHVTGSLLAPEGGGIEIDGSAHYAGTIEVTGSLSRLEVGASLSGAVHIDGDLYDCVVGGYLEANPSFYVGRTLYWLWAYHIAGYAIQVGALETGTCYCAFWGGDIQAGHVGMLTMGPGPSSPAGAFMGTLSASDVDALWVFGPFLGSVNVGAGMGICVIEEYVEAGATIQADSIGTLEVGVGYDEYIAGSILVTSTIGSATLNCPIEANGLVQTADMGTLNAYGPVTGRVSVSDSLGTAYVSNISPAGRLEAGTIDSLDAPNLEGTLVVGTLTDGNVGYIGSTGALDLGAVISLVVEDGIAGAVSADNVGYLEVVLGDISGEVVVAQELTEAVVRGSVLNLLQAGELVNLNLQGVSGTLRATSLLSGTASVGNVAGTVEVGTLAGQLNTEAVSGSVSVANDATGSIAILPPEPTRADLTGLIEVLGATSGSITVGGSITGSGTISVASLVDPNDQLDGGHIRVFDSLLDEATISVAQRYEGTEFLCIS